MITSSLEEYLKTMYVIKKQGQDIKVTTIANKMNCTKPSVNKELNNLKENGLVNYESYGTIEITKKRRRLSKKDIRSIWHSIFIFERRFKFEIGRCKKWSWENKIYIIGWYYK